MNTQERKKASERRFFPWGPSKTHGHMGKNFVAIPKLRGKGASPHTQDWPPPPPPMSAKEATTTQGGRLQSSTWMRAFVGTPDGMRHTRTTPPEILRRPSFQTERNLYFAWEIRTPCFVCVELQYETLASHIVAAPLASVALPLSPPWRRLVHLQDSSHEPAGKCIIPSLNNHATVLVQHLAPVGNPFRSFTLPDPFGI
jgi:hypothetical protein